MDLLHTLDRTVLIQALPETVFRFFQESPKWASWWGPGSTIDPVPGGKVYIRHPNGIETVGEVVEIVPPERIVFTYGYASSNPIPPGASRVTIRLKPDAAGTRLRLRHEFAEAHVRDQHVQGWRFQLSLFSNAVADHVFAGAAALIDSWFDAWADTNPQTRDETLARIAAPAITFRDRYSALDSISDLAAHVAAAQRFMPGVRMERKGDVRQCQGAVLADWVVRTPDGQERMFGTNLFLLGPDCKFTAVTGFAR